MRLQLHDQHLRPGHRRPRRRSRCARVQCAQLGDATRRPAAAERGHADHSPALSPAAAPTRTTCCSRPRVASPTSARSTTATRAAWPVCVHALAAASRSPCTPTSETSRSNPTIPTLILHRFDVLADVNVPTLPDQLDVCFRQADPKTIAPLSNTFTAPCETQNPFGDAEQSHGVAADVRVLAPARCSMFLPRARWSTAASAPTTRRSATTTRSRPRPTSTTCRRS